MQNPDVSTLPPEALVAQYVRMSNENQEYSIANQMSVIRTYAESRGYTIVKTYADEGRSGLTLHRREALRKLLQDVVNGNPGFSRIIVFDISRWGRFQDVDESAHYEFLCRRAGVAVDYCFEQFANDNSPTSNIMKSLKRSMAAEYSRELGSRVFLAKRQAAERGFWTAGPPGYALRRALVDSSGNLIETLLPGQWKRQQSQRTILIPGPQEEIDVVHRIYAEYLRGNTVDSIWQGLNRDGIPNVNGKTWHKGNVLAVLFTEKYVGTLIYGATTKRTGTFVRVPTEQRIVRPHTINAIVSRELFDRVRAERVRRLVRPSKEDLLKKVKEIVQSGKELSVENIRAAIPRGFRVAITRLGGMSKIREDLVQPGRVDCSYLSQQATARTMLPDLIAQVQRHLLANGQNATVEKATDRILVDGIPRVLVKIARKSTVAEWPAWHLGKNALANQANVVVIGLMNDKNTELESLLMVPRASWHHLGLKIRTKQLRRLADYEFDTVNALHGLLKSRTRNL